MFISIDEALKLHDAAMSPEIINRAAYYEQGGSVRNEIAHDGSVIEENNANYFHQSQADQSLGKLSHPLLSNEVFYNLTQH